MNYLISSPRSGNTMARYIFEMLTNKPTNGVCGEPNKKDILQRPLLHKGLDYCLHKRHDFKGVAPTDFVLFIVRDPFEAVIRHNRQKRGISIHQMQGYLDSWFELLDDYDAHTGNKMLIYYENLQKISSRESIKIYPDPQSNHPHYHKLFLPKDELLELTKYSQKKWGDLIEIYCKQYFS